MDDLAYSWGRLWRTPTSTIIAVLILALGIGVNTALFTILNGLLLKALPVRTIDKIFLVTEVQRSTGRVMIELPDEDLRETTDRPFHPFRDIARTDPLIGALSGAGSADVVFGELVSGRYFQMMGVSARAGRLLGPEDDELNEIDTPIVISERLWRRWFSADAAVIGKGLMMADYPLVVVGVATDDFKGTWLPNIMTSDVWIPMRSGSHVITTQGTPKRTAHRTFATLRDGISLEQANAFMDTVGRQSHPVGRDIDLAVLPGRDGIVLQPLDHYGRLFGSAVLTLSGLVFLIACANQMNVSLARGAARSAEIAVRIGLGASRRRIVQLLLSETVIVTGLAGLLGLLLTFLVARLMDKFPLPPIDGLTFTVDSSPDLLVFAFALLVALVGSVVVGVLPARRAANTNPWRLIGSGGITGTTAVCGRRLRTRLVVSQMAMSVVLVISAGICVRTLVRAAHVDVGFDVSHLATASVDFTMQKYGEARGRQVLRKMLDGADNMAGVQRAALASSLPAADAGLRVLVSPEETPAGRDASLAAKASIVSPGFFSTVGLPVRVGRGFTEEDSLGAPRVAVVSERLAGMLWPSQQAIGQKLAVGANRIPISVIGVAADTTSPLRNAVDLSLYLPLAQEYSTSMSIIIRTVRDPASFLGSLHQTMHAADPDLAVLSVRTVEGAIGFPLLLISRATLVFGTLGVIGFGISLLGIYGVMAYSVTQRAGEFGVHVALGATSGRVYAMVFREAAPTLLKGVIPGLVAAFIGATFLERALQGVRANDPLAFILIPTALIASGLSACYLPARRAAHTNPVAALRQL